MKCFVILAAGLFISAKALATPLDAKSRIQTLYPTIEATINSCKIRYKDFYQGNWSNEQKKKNYYGNNPYYSSEPMSIYMDCEQVEDKKEFAASHCAHFNFYSNRWQIDSSCIDVHDDRDGWLAHSRVGQIKTVNGSGFFLIEDDTNGAEANRGQFFLATIFYRGLVLQAHGRTGLLRDPKHSLVPHMLRLLKTVEFIE